MEIISGWRVRLDLESKTDGDRWRDRGQGSIFRIQVYRVTEISSRGQAGLSQLSDEEMDEEAGIRLDREQVHMGQTDYGDR